MINIVLVSHGDLGDALIRATEMIVGPTERIFSVPLLPNESPEGFGEKLAVALQDIKGEETLILIDLFGGTPYNVAARQVLKGNVECVTGVNLPMLLELVMSRDGASLPELAETITQSGREAIKNLGPMLNK
ncbi:MAG TPA: PTS sugar transporter subunit IIA [Thermoflexia bacterium]|nr:MAG: PTS mannose transporter subunit IIAB [Chloroflexota bacterium]HEY68145.1 PTS sugar transporter subunit IIA [Thermoflexia bacterium]